MITQAYVNVGRWIADCPMPDCNNAIALEPGQTQFCCLGGCLALAEVEWPPDADEITRVLEVRPVANNRNWAPAGHRQARSSGHPDGQTVAELINETREHEGAI